MALLVAPASCIFASGTITNCTETDLATALAAGGLVTFAQDCSITLSSTITIAASTTIDAQGHQVSLSGGNSVQLFNVTAPFTLLGITVSGGKSVNGGALWIRPSGSVVLSNCTFTGNSAIGGNGYAGTTGADGSGVGQNGGNGTLGYGAWGGAIYNNGSLTLFNCRFLTNSAQGGNGGDGGGGGNGGFQGGNGGSGGAGNVAYGGAIYNTSALWITNSTFAGNRVTGGNGGAGGPNGSGPINSFPGSGAAGAAGSGAAIYSTHSVAIWSSTFNANIARSGNSAAGGGDGAPGPGGPSSYGGGLCTLNGGGINNCTFYANQAYGGNGGNGGAGSSSGGNGGNGGGAAGANLYSMNTMTVVNCTFSTGSAVGGTNGLGGSGSFNGNDGSPGGGFGGNIANGAGIFTLRNSITAAGSPANGSGSFSDGGHNLSSDASIPLGGSSLPFTSAKLGPLADNGGPTQTMALLTNSPARDRIASNFPPTDQRGFPRAINGAADIGAYEYEFAGKPVISQQPLDQISALDAAATFTVVAVGATPLTYQWRLGGTNYASGTNIDGATSASYTVQNADPSIAGPYRVRVTNGSGTADSAPAFIRFAPSIISGPDDYSAQPGDAAVFTVDATGDDSATLYYQWRFNGTNDIRGATDSSFTIGSAQQTDVGAYSVVITNVFGSITSPPAFLNLAPGILVQPTDIAIVAGSNATFSVSAFGSAPLRYQWRNNITNIIPTATAPNYIIARVQPINAGIYDVIVSNNFGAVTSITATLTVLGPAAIITQPANTTVAAGSNATFNVTADGTPPLSYQWQYNRTNIPSATATSLLLTAVQPNNAGNYRVVITNNYGSITSSEAVLTVLLPPIITAQPTNVSVTAGTNASFHVTATGGALTYQWWLNGVTRVPTGNGPTLAFPVVQGSNQGSYSVVVTNTLGAVTSSVATLTVLGPPFITLQPVSKSVPVGTSLELIAGAGGSEPLSYQWKFNGTNLAGGTATNLPLPNVQSSDAGSYTLVVTNTAGSITSAPAILSVGLAPIIVVGPVSQAVSVGSNAMFTVTASGTASLQYQWQFNGTNLAGQTATNLSLTAVQLNNAGSYAVVVTNNFGAVTSPPAILAVTVAPSIITQPASQIALVGSNANFAVIAGGSQPLSYQWRFNGTNLLGQTATNLSLSNLQFSNAGPYTVVVTNNYGAITSAPATLAVGIPPFIITPPAGQTSSVGGTLTFSVTAGGSTNLSYQWQFNGNNLAGQTASNYVILNVQSNQAGAYSVMVSNVFGATSSPPATLTVLLAPSIVTPPASMAVEVGSSVTFQVTAVGAQPLNYQWRWNGNTLQGAVGPTFALNDVQTYDAGGYDVIVANSYGSVRSGRAVLTVVDVLPTFTLAIPNPPTLGQVQLTLHSDPGLQFEIQVSTNLVQWLGLLPHVTNTTGTAVFTYTPTVDSPAHYYRAKWLP